MPTFNHGTVAPRNGKIRLVPDDDGANAVTGAAHALDIDTLIMRAVPGRIGMSRCPGLAVCRGWRRPALEADLGALRAWGARVLVTLMEADELEYYGVGALPQAARAAGLDWLHLPIPDMGVPDAAFEARWASAGAALHARLGAGEHVVLHCFAGLGRTGTVAARLLVERGHAPEQAIAAVRAARPGTIQTPAQEAYVLALRPGPFAEAGDGMHP